MTNWICTDIDAFQWQRKASRWSTDYEMYQISPHPDFENETSWFAGGGRFSIEDYDMRDIKFVLGLYGYKLDGIDNDVLAECLFECNWSDFPIETFETEEEAIAYVERCMEGEE